MIFAGIEIAGLENSEWDDRTEVAAPDGCQASHTSYKQMIPRRTLDGVMIEKCGRIAHP